MKEIIYDGDFGVDDGLALILALNSGVVDVKAVTTVNGNTSSENAARNATRILNYLGKKNVPVNAMMPSTALYSGKEVHGEDGMGDSFLPKYERAIEPWSFFDVVTQASKGARTLVATGPLTNVAETLKRFPGFDEVIIMGGAINVPGNIDRRSEFNFYADPQAANYVLTKTPGIRKVLVPLDVTDHTLLTPEHLKRIRNTKSGKLARSIVKGYHDFYKSRGFDGNPLHDPLAMGYAIDPTFLELEEMDVRVETKGEYTRGMCVVEERGWMKKYNNVFVATKVERKEFLEYFVETISRKK